MCAISLIKLNNSEDIITESVYYYENLRASKSINDMSFYCINDNIDNGIVKSYLMKNNISKMVPDDTNYWNDIILSEYYVDDINDRVIIILRTLSSNSETYNPISISCISLNMNDFVKIGHIKAEINNQDDVTSESFYDVSDNLIGNIRYFKYSDFPFSIMTDLNIETDGKDIAFDVLNRGQKLWLVEDLIEFNKNGQISTYSGDIFNTRNNRVLDNIGEKINFYYENNLLTKIVGDQLSDYLNNIEYSDYNNELRLNLDIKYSDHNIINKVKYQRSTLIYGTFDSNGVALYDDFGRLVYTDSYITHGRLYNYYLYSGDNKRPWLCVSLDSMSNDGELIDGVNFFYGNYMNIYMFEGICD